MKILRLSTITLAASAAVACLAASAQAQVVSVQFARYGNGSELQGLNTAGYNMSAGVISENNWNVGDPGVFTTDGGGSYTYPSSITSANSITDPNGNLTGMVDSNGNPTSVTFSIANTNFYEAGSGSGANYGNWPGALTQSPGITNNYDLVNGVWMNYNGTTTLTLGGLDSNASYNLFLYFGTAGGWPSGPSQATLGSTTYYFNADVGSLTGYTQSTSTDSTVSPVADYVEFTNVSASALESGASVAATVQYNNQVGISGFQLQAVAVPEPATVWSAVLGLFGLVAFGVRRNRTGNS